MSGQHAAIVRSFSAAARPAVLVDFDGTISDIVPVPDDARPVEGAVEVLSGLVRAGVAVTVLSSRPVAFLRSVLNGLDAGVGLVGHSGLEVFRAGTLSVEEAVAPWTAVVERTLDQARRAAPEGVRIEDKGLSFAFHYREAPARAEEVAVVAERLASDSGLKIKAGRMNLELRPPVPVDKGTAVGRGLDGSADWVLVAGDDVVDVPAFEVVGAGPWEAVTVAVGSTELPADLARAARLGVERPADLVALLDVLLAAKGDGSGA